MGTGRPDDADLAAHLRPVAPPAMPSSLRAASRRPGLFNRAIVLGVGGENVVVVLGDDAGDADAVWGFIRQRMAGRSAGLM